MKLRTDFVSNSSSSSFICKTKMLPERVKTKLKRMITLYNREHKTEKRLLYQNVFEDPFRPDKKFIDDLIRYWLKDDEYMTNEAKEATVIINSDGDNTIPDALFDKIEAIFDAHRIHLG